MLSGFEPEKDIPIKFIGLRPGEKMYEELYAADETVNNTKHPQIFEVLSEFDSTAAAFKLNELEDSVKEKDNTRLLDFISRGYLVYV